jgi:hypothetical protein
MIIRKKYGVRELELWFDPISIPENVDVILHRQCFHKKSQGQLENFYTLVFPLGEEDSTLFPRIKRRAKEDIRRADREGLDFQAPAPSKANIKHFCSFYNEFAAQKGRSPISTAYLEELADAGMLKLTAAAKEGTELVWHSLVVTPRRARILHSASHFRSGDQAWRNAVGRANRWLHWRDILYFKSLGLTEYDFGGWYEGKDDPEKLQINQFKEAFGGVTELNYNIVYANSLKGQIFLSLRTLCSRLPGLQRIHKCLSSRYSVLWPFRTGGKALDSHEEPRNIESRA